MRKIDMEANHEILDIVNKAYRKYRDQVCSYILYKINNVQDAEDLTQDVFVRLLEHCQTIRLETAQNMIYTIAKNLVIDYLRRLYYKQEAIDYFMNSYSEISNYTEDCISAKDLAEQENHRISLLPPQRQKIYSLVRFEEKSIQEIALMMDLSPRTVENHLLLSRKEIRSYIKQCI